MGLIALHSAHFSKIFKRLMGTGCGLKWRVADERERLWVVAPGHPIAAGLPDSPAEQIPGIIGQASEALDSVPLIADAVRKAGMGSSALDGLSGLIAGEISPGEWMARVRQAERARREPAAGGRAA